MQFSQDISRWMRSVEQRLAPLEVVERQCGQTPMTFRVCDREIVRWVERALSPLFGPNSDPIEEQPCPALHFHHLYSDSLVSEITQLFNRHDECRIDDEVGASGGYRYSYGIGNTMLLDPREGVAIHLNLLDRQFHFVHSSRTRWPNIQFGDMVYEPVLRSAQQHGGGVFHAGSVVTEQGAILIVGYAGDGKSTLVTGLMRAGAAYLSNERTLVKQVADGFNAYTFCDYIQLGLGTAMQDPALAKLLPFPDQISLPQRRFEYGRLDRYRSSKWPGLSDKLSLLCDEFSSLLDAPPPQSGVPLIGVIRPDVSSDPVQARITPLSKTDRHKLLDDNASSRSHYPDWMRWNIPEAEPDIESLAKLPALRVKFHLANGQIQGLDDPLGAILEAFDHEREDGVSASPLSAMSPQRVPPGGVESLVPA